MTVLAAAVEPSHGTHLLQASAFVLVALVGIGVGERVKRPPALIVVLSLAGAAAGAVHLGVTPSHWAQAPVYGAFFLLAGTAQLAYSALLLLRSLRGLVAVAVVGNLGLLLLWVQTRTTGVPLGPAAGLREPVGPLDLACAGLELVVVVAGVALLSRQATPSRRSASIPAPPTGCRP
jgi:hypothetical protein